MRQDKNRNGKKDVIVDWPFRLQSQGKQIVLVFAICLQGCLPFDGFQLLSNMSQEGDNGKLWIRGNHVFSSDWSGAL